MGEDSKYGLISISLVLIIFFSMLLIASPVSATTATPPSSPVTVQQGQVFLLRGTITLDKSSTAWFTYGPVYWYNYGDPAENFRLENTPSVYWDNNPGDPVENVSISECFVPDGWQVNIGDNGDGIARNGTFTIDIWLRAASGDGTLHRADNQDIYFAMDQITIFEPNPVGISAGPITIQVLGRGVDVSISPDNQSGVPCTTLNYTVTVTNTGNMGKDNYNLTVSDNAGWGGSITFDNTRLENIPENENRTATLHVHIPENAIGCTRDNITIKATSQGDNTKKDNASCIAHVTIVRVVNVSISPTYQENLPGAPLTYTVTVINKGNVTDSYALSVSDNENWGPTLSENQFNSVPPFNDNRRETTLSVTIPENAAPCTRDNITIIATSKKNENAKAENSCIAHAATVRGVTVSISPSYQSGLPEENLIYEVRVTNTGNAEDSYNLTVGDSAAPSWSPRLSESRLDNVQPDENRTIVLSVVVPSDAVGCTVDNIRVTVTSVENLDVENSENCQAHALIFRRVEVSISPGENSSPPEDTVTYTITVKNMGNVDDNYALTASDDAGWSLNLDDNSLTIGRGENGTTTLRVGIPENAENCTRDNVAVTATSKTDNTIENSDNCVAHALIIRGVEVSISPGYQSGVPESTLSYVVTIKNTGNIEDNYALIVNDNDNWAPTLDNAWLVVPRNDNRTITLRVTVPENAVPCTRDNITVTAIGTGVSAENSCIAHAALPVGVEISISPHYDEGPLGTVLNYIVIVKNLGGQKDNYDLIVSDILGWPLGLSDNLLTNIPPDESENVTLTVTIPENAMLGNEDNITVTATSQADNTIGASASCIAHALGIKTEIRILIYPAADIYAFGEYAEGYSRSQLKFDISSIPLGSGIISAKLCMYRLAADNWDGNVTLHRVENQSWGEDITASEFDAQPLTDGKNNAGKFMAHGWDNLDVLTQLKVDYDAAHTFTSFRLGWANDSESEPSAGVDDGRFLVINGEAEELSIIFCASEYDGRDPYLEVVYVPPHAVSISISPTYISRLPGENVTFLVTVMNTGNLDDNYSLNVSDNTGWGLSLLPSVLSVASGSSGGATLTVAIPDNATGCTQDNITVIATSQTDNTVSDSDSCIAHAEVVRRVEISIEPRSQFGFIGENAVFIVTIKNMGNIWENYRLENSDDAGWALKLNNGYLEIPKNENRETNLTVFVPDDENLVFTRDNVTVVATAVDNIEVTDNDTVAIQAALHWMGAATFKLENLYKVNLNKDLRLYAGSKLVVKFYKYDNVTLQAESVIHSFTPPENAPENVKENESVPHPRGAEGYPWGSVQIARLVLTTDNTENVISTIASFTVHQSDLRRRVMDILRAWGDRPDQQSAFRAEVMDILRQWGDAPP